MNKASVPVAMRRTFLWETGRTLWMKPPQRCSVVTERAGSGASLPGFESPQHRLQLCRFGRVSVLPSRPCKWELQQLTPKGCWADEVSCSAWGPWSRSTHRNAHFMLLFVFPSFRPCRLVVLFFIVLNCFSLCLCSTLCQYFLTFSTKKLLVAKDNEEFFCKIRD